MKQLKFSYMKKIVLIANKGSELNLCIIEAILLAIDEWIEVELRFNGHNYRIMPGQLSDTVMATRDKYGKGDCASA